MRRVACLLFLFLAAGCSAAVLASESVAHALAQRLQFHSFQAKFTQTVSSQQQASSTSSGQVWIQRPGKFRWQVQRPEAQLLIVNNREVWQYDPLLEQATHQHLSESQGISAVNLLSGNVDVLLKQFRIQEIPAKSSRKIFMLTPKKSGLFEHLWLIFSGPQLIAMKTDNALGQQTTYQFSQVKMNVKLASSLFHFTPPQGVDVLDG